MRLVRIYRHRGRHRLVAPTRVRLTRRACGWVELPRRRIAPPVLAAAVAVALTAVLVTTGPATTSQVEDTHRSAQVALVVPRPPHPAGCEVGR